MHHSTGPLTAIFLDGTNQFLAEPTQESRWFFHSPSSCFQANVPIALEALPEAEFGTWSGHCKDWQGKIWKIQSEFRGEKGRFLQHVFLATQIHFVLVDFTFVSSCWAPKSKRMVS